MRSKKNVGKKKEEKQGMFFFLNEDHGEQCISIQELWNIHSWKFSRPV